MRFIKNNVLYDTEKSTLLGSVDILYDEYSPVYGWLKFWRQTKIYLTKDNRYFTLHQDRDNKWIMEVVEYKDIELKLEAYGIDHVPHKDVIKIERANCRFKYNGRVYDTNNARLVYYGPVTHLGRDNLYHVRPTWVYVDDVGRYFYVFRKGGNFKGKIFPMYRVDEFIKMKDKYKQDFILKS